MSAFVLTAPERPRSSPASRRPLINLTNGSPILVASDGRPEADGAIRMARLIAGDLVPLLSVGVVQPMPMVSPEVQLASFADVEERRRDGLAVLLQSQFRRLVRARALGEMEIREGDPAMEIAAAADDARARLIVTGIGRHQIVDRVFGDETALKLMRVSRVPVLAVPAGTAALPRQIVIGTDFSATCTRVLVEAIMLAGDEARIHVVHVAPRDVLAAAAEPWAKEYLDSVGLGFKSIRHQVALRTGMQAEYLLLEGDPAKELLAYGARIGSDLIAVGSHGHRFLSRQILGSVSTTVLRESHCSVLVAPYLGRD